MLARLPLDTLEAGTRTHIRTLALASIPGKASLSGVAPQAGVLVPLLAALESDLLHEAEEVALVLALLVLLRSLPRKLELSLTLVAAQPPHCVAPLHHSSS